MMDGHDPRDGTTLEGQRFVLLHEDIFMEWLESVAEREQKELTVEWGEPKTHTLTYFAPDIYELTDPDDAEGQPG